MSNESLLTYVWISLENFNNSILKQEPLLKTLLPIATAFMGVFLGLFANTIKDYYTKRKNDKAYKKLFIDEVTIIISDMASLLPKLFSFMDNVVKDKELKNAFYAPKISKLGYEEFYPKIVHLFDIDEKKLIRKIYNDVGKINDRFDEFSFKLENKDDYMDHIIKSGEFCFDCIAMYIDCNKLIDGELFKIKTATDVMNELNIKSKFFDDFKESNKDATAKDKSGNNPTRKEIQKIKFETKY
ncbi:hypothetical protein GW643_23910 [Serratia marcescens]|uniref:hypothetical protein n=1 Tax=Serratia marcescens TaxID=615 RepID=UPI0013781F0D|nr:hypothetical protein [Serratia marcescens]NCJ13414.1 hypothetical protein [Serratia marcescens]NDJ04617.1 hypothetical protein [Serratia marcescens]